MDIKSSGGSSSSSSSSSSSMKIEDVGVLEGQGPPLSPPQTPLPRTLKGIRSEAQQKILDCSSSSGSSSSSSSSNTYNTTTTATINGLTTTATTTTTSTNITNGIGGGGGGGGDRPPPPPPPHPLHAYSPPTTHYKAAYTNGGGAHSPLPTPTPSPPALSSPPSLEQPPPATTATTTTSTSSTSQRQIVKVRRFLTTLHQFASDISQEVGERVRHLVLGLLSGAVTVEEFHVGLQAVTHFPLRPFVLPFLRAHLPLLQHHLHTLARRANMPISQYVSVHEAAALDSTTGELNDFFQHDVTHAKRRHEGYFENGDVSGNAVVGASISPPPSKRLMLSGVGGTRLFSPPPPPPPPTTSTSSTYQFTSGVVSTSPSPPPPPVRDYNRNSAATQDDEWKNIHVMLTCILSMVEKTRRALTILQERESSGGGGSARGTNAAGGGGGSGFDAEVRRHAAELVQQSIRATEERVSEVKRKAEEAVCEVRRAAVAEVQRAVAAAEARAQELVAAERAKVGLLLRDLNRREPGSGEARLDPQQACWNCGKKAHETCSGCNVARYCGPFCQHKDWDGHHKVCSPGLSNTSPSAAGSSSLVAALVKAKFPSKDMPKGE